MVRKGRAEALLRDLGREGFMGLASTGASAPAAEATYA